MPTPVISAYRNSAYGPPLVNQKYAPLEDIVFTGADTDTCDAFLTRRWQLLAGMGLLPQPLHLIVPKWSTVTEAEDGTKPPLVVISTNRSNWIKKGIEAGNVQLTNVKLKQFVSASDLRALTALTGQTQSPPIYAPARIGDPDERKVYVVVHAAEYDTYKTNLAGTGITVVGWSFQPPRRRSIPLCGFGASRYAAIEFCKYLRTQAGEPWDYAWLFDDNVVALGPFAGYQKVEDAMAAGGKTRACAGFHGGTVTLPPSEIRAWADKEVKAGRGKQTSKLEVSKPPGLIQQASLWNIAYLTENKLNFGPIFIQSGEDVSIGNYFDVEETPYLYYEGVTIRKEDVTNDNSEGAKAVKKAREKLTAVITKMERLEAGAPFITPPPPIKIKPLIKTDDPVNDDEEQTMARFVSKSVLPHASDDIQARATEPATRNTAWCQATEQTICKAIKLGWVSDAAQNQTFKINGDGTQAIEEVER